VPKSRRNSTAVALAAMAIVAAGAVASAHRRDEYLQAARIALDPQRVRIELDLTPGIDVADGVIARIDRDRNGSISPDEARAYAATVRDELSFDVDGQPVHVEVSEPQMPALPAVRQGEGAIRLELTGTLPQLQPGAHLFRYRNRHRPDIGAYLSNALVPASDTVAITAQHRDTNQSELAIAYELGGSVLSGTVAQVLVIVGAAVLIGFGFWWSRKPGR
jgi:hypothetical protein